MSTLVPGIHHLTAVASDPQRNIDFYTGALGLRLVKLTVNFDDPSSYHLYYGDRAGSPGTLLTFFPHRGLPRGRTGAGQVTATALAVPASSLDFWRRRLDEFDVGHTDAGERFGEPVLALEDPDGMPLELIGVEGLEADVETVFDGVVPAHSAIRRMHSVTMTVRSLDATSRLLTDTLGMRASGAEGERTRYAMAQGGAGALVDVRSGTDDPAGRRGAGIVHHVAWRTPDDESQITLRNDLATLAHNVTTVQERCYFRSIYFLEPGGVLFEIATDGPGMAIDESVEELGSALRLPPWFEGRREEIEKSLPKIRLPE